MSSVVISGDTSGAITLQAPAVSGNTTLNLPASSGTVLTQNSSAPANSFVVDASGNVGVGVTQSTDKFAVASSGNAAYFANNTANTLSNRVKLHLAPTSDFGANWSTFEPPYIGAFNNAGFADCGLVFNTYDSGTNAERMRITTNGNVLVGATSALATNQHSFQSTSTSSAAVLALRNAGATAGLYWQVGPDSSSNFKVYNASNTGVFLANGGTSWSSSSDETLKENLVPIDNAIDKVMSLRTVIGNFIADENKQKRPFLIAQDVQKVFPEAISIAPEGTLGLAYSDMIPLLTAAIQELKAIVDEQAEKIKALEAK